MKLFDLVWQVNTIIYYSNDTVELLWKNIDDFFYKVKHLDYPSNYSQLKIHCKFLFYSLFLLNIWETNILLKKLGHEIENGFTSWYIFLVYLR